MAIETTQVDEFAYRGGSLATRQPMSRRSDWLSPHAGWALVGGVAGYLIGHWLGNMIASGYTQVQSTGQNDVAVVLGLSLGVVGFLAGVGGLNYPLAKLVGREPSLELPQHRWMRYFRLT